MVARETRHMGRGGTRLPPWPPFHYGKLVSSFASKFNLHRYPPAGPLAARSSKPTSSMMARSCPPFHPP
jgi:hypothetical protein